MSWHTQLEFSILVLIVLQVLSHGAHAAHNVTVDDADPSIQYTGDWSTTARTDRYMNTTHFTKIKGSYATFSFTGATQVYFMGYGIYNNADGDGTDIEIALDGQTHVVDTYRDISEHLQAILWGSDALDPATTHTIVCRKITDDYGGRDLNVDAFVLTIPDMAISSSVIPTTPSDSSSLTTVGSSSRASGVSSSTGTSRTESSPSIIVWNPSLGTDTLYESAPTSTSQSNGTIQASTGGSSGPNNLSKSIVVGIIFGAVGSICLIAMIFFYLGRRRDHLRHLETPQFDYTSPRDARWTPDDQQMTGQSAFLGAVQPTMKQTGRPHEELHQEGSVSSISSSNTHSRSGHIRSVINSDSVLDGPESNARETELPAYTPRPISGHYTTSRTRDAQRVRDIKGRQRL